MIVGFVIWSSVTLLLAGVGIWSWKSKKAAGFYAGVSPPEVSDVLRYNRSVGILWLAYAALFELLGLPLLFLKQIASGLLWTILGVAVLTVGLTVVYNRILNRYRIKEKKAG